MSDNLTVELTPAEVNIVRQALRAEGTRMTNSGYAQLGKLALDTSSKISDALIDRNISVG
jgi:hypothetical protein